MTHKSAQQIQAEIRLMRLAYQTRQDCLNCRRIHGSDGRLRSIPPVLFLITYGLPGAAFVAVIAILATILAFI